MFHAAMLHSSMATGDISNSNNNSCNIYSCCNMSCCNNARLWPLGHCGMWHAAAACGKTYARTLTRKTGSKNGRQQRVASRRESARAEAAAAADTQSKISPSCSYTRLDIRCAMIHATACCDCPS